MLNSKYLLIFEATVTNIICWKSWQYHFQQARSPNTTLGVEILSCFQKL